MTDAGMRTCPICGSADREDVFRLAGIPVLVNAQVSAERAMDVERGDIDLVVCLGCGHLYNRSFDEGRLDYDAAYENTLHYSAQFQQYARALAARLVEHHQLVGASVAELGSGPGHFLSMLCDAGVGRAYGYDPSYDPDRLGAPHHPSVTVSTDLFPSDGALAVRLALSQHVLEHLADPVSALAVQRDAVRAESGSVYTEVPNGQQMIDEVALWDLIYEHPSYFVPTSLRVACAKASLVIDQMGAVFGDQFMWCESHPGDVVGASGATPDAVAAAVEAARRFGDAARARVETARAELVQMAAAGPVVLWGAGSKGMTYLNVVGDVAPVAAVVDINPRKSGWGVPGTTHVISGPESLIELQPSHVLAANPVYVAEISAQLQSIGVHATVQPLWN